MFRLTKVDDITLIQVSAVRASKSVVPDAKHSFRQMSIVKITLLQQMTKFQWPKKAITATADFSTHIAVYPYWQHEFREQALLIYQVQVRQSWHDTLKQNSAFNITLFNEDLLQTIYKEVVDRAQVQSLNEVSTFANQASMIWANHYPPFLLNPSSCYKIIFMVFAIWMQQCFSQTSFMLYAMLLQPCLCLQNAYFNAFSSVCYVFGWQCYECHSKHFLACLWLKDTFYFQFLCIILAIHICLPNDSSH